MLHTVFAVVAGYVVMAVLVIVGTLAATAALVPGGMAAMRQPGGGLPPRSYLTANIILSVVAAIIAGWVTARIAPDAGFAAIAELAGLVLVLGFVSQRSERKRQVATASAPRQPSWYPMTITALGMVGVFVGGYLRLR